ncbi:MAG: long-chain fatty acid--CoA ligase [Deltaproteobacteria bacterium]|jgi:fatty-acyl-CoA synthase|nr:long-chain fatty acid--CoA ligase [Deltaproteobacteria bacterium]MBT4267240.1 long-chain fatty acid--CoA ligase [Deltaproteobacteria bacterium]MBT4640384.1 long-chain fatty acid--CoA ligase [Deltaproteobacteria bacterium]MBT6498609.1 long-chain fatty acid--CoA ligase [Deltaproteobacteria bacterium]MBT6611900.1 long-chain fatty acid--CoA ligase [Deltaproteobacteria bacterium]
MNWSFVIEKYAKECPDKEAIIFEDRRITYRQLNERVNALARGLLDFGIKKGDVAAILLNNCLEFLEVTFAVNKIGAVWLPLNYRLTGEELTYLLNHGDAKILFSEMGFNETLAGIKEKLPMVNQCIGVGKAVPSGWESYDGIIERYSGSEVEHAQVDMDDLERLMYTSGTTSRPKGVMLTYGNFIWKHLSHAITLKISGDDKALFALPMYHVGLDILLTTVLYMGGTGVILKSFDSVKFMETIAKEKITCTGLVPAMVNILFQEPSFDNYDLSSLRISIDGGEKMPLPLIEKWEQKLPGVWFADAYGLTETFSGDTFLAKDKMVSKVGSVGKPVPGMRFRIVDNEGIDVSPGKDGEIALRGPKVFKGYWKNKEATDEAIRDGWFFTGDIGYCDEEGFLYIVDRKKDMIISGGENVASAEVERVIYELAQVSEAAVVGIPHPKWLEVPKAFVVLKSGEHLHEQDIIAHCTKKLAKFKVPNEIEFISQLPRNPSGKVLKRKLRENQISDEFV